MSRETLVGELVRAQSRVLKMPGLARVFEGLARQAREEKWAFEEYLQEVLAACFQAAKIGGFEPPALCIGEHKIHFKPAALHHFGRLYLCLEGHLRRGRRQAQQPSEEEG